MGLKIGISNIPERFKDPLSLLPESMQISISKYYSAICKIKPDIVHAWQDQTNVEASLVCEMLGVPGVVIFARSLRPDGKSMAHMRKRKYFKEAYKAILENQNIQFSHNSDAGKLSYSSWLKIAQKGSQSFTMALILPSLKLIQMTEKFKQKLIRFRYLMMR